MLLTVRTLRVNGKYGSLAGKRIFITGHSGFTGSWVSIWLKSIGAEVYGYSLEPETSPNLFTSATVSSFVEGTVGDIRDFNLLKTQMSKFKPDLVLHLAAQPLVRRSYKNPRETFEVNSQGTVNVLEASRTVTSIKGVLCITTDKVYKNTGTGRRFIETDQLGGHDPYSASKAAAELSIESYRQLFALNPGAAPVISVARGGNIIGGGDWSEDRLVPDFIRSYLANEPLTIRNPFATRPWQHVISLVSGYLEILCGIIGEDAAKFNRAFNLGPMEEESISVSALLEKMQGLFHGVTVVTHPSELVEADKLSIDSSLAKDVFAWNPRWTTSQSIEKTAEWYLAFLGNPTGALEACHGQLDSWLAS